MSPFYYIEKPLGNRWVIPDIHACSTTFATLIQQLKLSSNDQLFLLGDYINRGRSSSEVINFILKMIEKGLSIFPLRGNHEQMFLDKITKNIETIPSRGPNVNLFDENGMVFEKYLNFFEELPYYYEIDIAILVHGGISNNLLNYNEMLWSREPQDLFGFQLKKQIIHGHTPTNLDEILHNINYNYWDIPLDNGCVFKSNANFGNLIAYNIDSKEVIIQKNID